MLQIIHSKGFFRSRGSTSSLRKKKPRCGFFFRRIHTFLYCVVFFPQISYLSLGLLNKLNSGLPWLFLGQSGQNLLRGRRFATQTYAKSQIMKKAKFEPNFAQDCQTGKEKAKLLLRGQLSHIWLSEKPYGNSIS